MNDLTHFDEFGRSRMVDVSAKQETVREATATATVMATATAIPVPPIPFPASARRATPLTRVTASRLGRIPRTRLRPGSFSTRVHGFEVYTGGSPD